MAQAGFLVEDRFVEHTLHVASNRYKEDRELPGCGVRKRVSALRKNNLQRAAKEKPERRADKAIPMAKRHGAGLYQRQSVVRPAQIQREGLINVVREEFELKKLHARYDCRTSLRRQQVSM